MKSFYYIFLIILLLSIEVGLSQTSKDKEKRTYFRFDEEYEERWRLRERRELTEREFILEDVINPEEYIVGPGDVFAIYIWGQEENLFEAMVLPEGNIIIPSIGSFMVNNRTLTSAKEIIIEKTKVYYPSADISVLLTGIRKFKVYVSGEVLIRGSFDASPIDRLSNIIAKAQGFTSWADKKAIEIKHQDGNIDKFDILDFESKGNIDNNPFVRSGDIIFIPRVKFSEGVVFISGNIDKQGYHQLYNSETISGLIARINIEKESTDWENAFIKRKSDSNDNVFTNIPLNFFGSSNENNTSDELFLKNNDIIYLPKKINEVYVFGAVRSPGAYPFRSNMKSGDYASLAGKTEHAASNSKIKVIRDESEKVLKGPNVTVERGDKIEVPIRTTELTKDYLQIVGTFTSILIAAKAVGIIK